MKQNLILVLIIVLLSSGCDKRENDENVPLKSCRIRTFQRTQGSYGAIETLSYDDNDRLTKIDNGSSITTFSYTSDKIMVKFTTGASDLVYNLDALGRIINGNNYTFKYNTEGYLIEALKDYGSFYVKLTMSYENGNLVKVERYSSGPTQVNQLVYTFQYTEDSFQKAGEDINPLTNDLNIVQPRELSVFIGKSVKNRMSKIISTNQGSVQTSTFTYQKDAESNISLVDIILDGKPFRKNILTYECK